MALNRSAQPHVFYCDTSSRKLCPEPFTTLLLGLARMTQLPLDYLGEGLACPLARLRSTKDLYYLVPLRIRLGVYILLQSKLFDAICEIIVLANHLGCGFGVEVILGGVVTVYKVLDKRKQ